MDGSHELTSSLVVGMLVSEIIEIAKRAKWCPINYNTENLNRTVGAIAAFLSGLGLSISFDAAAGRLVVDGIFLGAITHGVSQWAIQMGYWRIAIRRSQPPEPSPVVIVAPDQDAMRTHPTETETKEKRL